MYVKYNPNPLTARVGDCTVRAISKALNQDWDTTYLDLCVYGLILADMPSSNNVWSMYLHNNGFKRHMIPFSGDLYTVRDFVQEHSKGVYILALNGHVVAVENGRYFDTWDSGNETPLFYWTKEE